MQEKVKATWVIAAILIGILSVLSYFPSGDSTAEILPVLEAQHDAMGSVFGDDISATTGKFTN